MFFPVLDMQAACAALAQGKIVIYPTETFYGMGCNALDPDAVGAVYAAKCRPYGLPLPVIIGAKEQLATVADHVFPVAQRLLDRFWPGPLSIIFPAASHVPDLLTGDTRRVAVRLSSHPAAAQLASESGFVLSSSSANVSGREPVTRLQLLDRELAPHVAGVFAQGPPPEGGLPSTIVDVLPGADGEGVIRLLRQGAVSVETLQKEGFVVYVAEI